MMGLKRRDFLKQAGISTAGFLLNACQMQYQNHIPTDIFPTSTQTALPTPIATQTALPTHTQVPMATFCTDQITRLVSENEIDFLVNHEVTKGDTSRKVIMMTYDDNGRYQEIRSILDAFKAFHMKATFFFIGEKIPLSSKAVHAVVDEGHLLACHGYAHNNFMALSNDQINRRIEKCFKVVDEIVPGYRMRFIRFPYGSGVGSERILRAVAQWGLQHIYWSTGSNGTIPDTLGTVMRNAENGAIVLSHMHRYYDINQAPEIVAGLVEAGYSLETIETGRAPEDKYQP